jgi:hypothetical protein
MSKLQLNKETIANLSNEEAYKIKGGTQFPTNVDGQEEGFVTITIGLSIRYCSTPQGTCFSCQPGTQDSCGLCATHYRCDF